MCCPHQHPSHGEVQEPPSLPPHPGCTVDLPQSNVASSPSSCVPLLLVVRSLGLTWRGGSCWQTGGATAGARRRSRRAPPPRRPFTRQHPSRGRLRGCRGASPRARQACAGRPQTAGRAAGRCVRLPCDEGSREGNASTPLLTSARSPAAAATRGGRAGIRLSAEHGQGNSGGGGRGRVGVRACGQRGQRHLVGARTVLACALLLDRASTCHCYCSMQAHHPSLSSHGSSHRHTVTPLQSPAARSSSVVDG